MSKVAAETKAVGKEAMDMILNECLNAVNEFSRHGGSAPCQGVLNKFPRTPATQGDEEEAHDVAMFKRLSRLNQAVCRWRFLEAEERETRILEWRSRMSQIFDSPPCVSTCHFQPNRQPYRKAWELI